LKKDSTICHKPISKTVPLQAAIESETVDNEDELPPGLSILDGTTEDDEDY
jgi:hypothetical protein